MYRFYKLDCPIDEKILEINGFSFDSINLRNFEPDLNEGALKNFYEKLISLRNENFFIVGDYDFDGISSLTIICRLLDRLHISHKFYIPSRIKEGYGISIEMVERAKKYGFTAIMTLDNGIVSNAEIKMARDAGLKFLVIDHHEYTDLPEADAVLHPSLLSEKYKECCAAGLCTLLSMCESNDDYSIALGGIATLADMVPVFRYNRWLIQKAMHLVNERSFPLLNMLSKRRVYDYSDLSFTLIPKVNAVSRMGYNANSVVQYFLSDSMSGKMLADKIDEINIERKRCTKEMMETAENLSLDGNIAVVHDVSFKEGLCGIVSGRLVEQRQKPVIVLSGDEILKGSGRSFGNFNLYEYLKNTEDLFETFGGHASAVGLSLKKENLSKLKNYIENHKISLEEEEKPVILFDSDDFNMETMEKIESLCPYGTGFKEIRIACKKKDTGRLFTGSYPKFRINEITEAILFDISKEKENCEYMIGRLSRNSFRKGTLTLTIEDFVDESAIIGF